MSRLPSIRARQLTAALIKTGFEPKRQKGSHQILKHPDGRWTVVPIHNEDVNRDLLKEILRQTEISEDEFRELL